MTLVAAESQEARNIAHEGSPNYERKGAYSIFKKV